jgi:hypothetical protein
MTEKKMFEMHAGPGSGNCQFSAQCSAVQLTCERLKFWLRCCCPTDLPLPTCELLALRLHSFSFYTER